MQLLDMHLNSTKLECALNENENKGHSYKTYAIFYCNSLRTGNITNCLFSSLRMILHYGVV